MFCEFHLNFFKKWGFKKSHTHLSKLTIIYPFVFLYYYCYKKCFLLMNVGERKSSLGTTQ